MRAWDLPLHRFWSNVDAGLTESVARKTAPSTAPTFAERIRRVVTEEIERIDMASWFAGLVTPEENTDIKAFVAMAP